MRVNWKWLMVLLALTASPPLALARSFPYAPDAALASQQRWGAGVSQGYVAAGCLPAVGAAQMPACRAFALAQGVGDDPSAPPAPRLVGFEETLARPLPIPGVSGYYLLIGRADPALTPSGWTCQPGTHYCIQRQLATLLSIPAGTVELALLTWSGASITEVYDLRPGRPWTTAVDVTAPIYGAIGDGITNDQPGIAAACRALEGRAFWWRLSHNVAVGNELPQLLLLFPPHHTFKATATITCDVPHNTVIEASGSTHLATFDGVHYDLNPGGDCSQPAPSNCLNQTFTVVWRGGTFGNTAPTKTQSYVWKFLAARHFELSDTFVTSSNDLSPYGVLWVSIQDSLFVHHNFWALNDLVGSGARGYGIVQFQDENQAADGSYVRISDNSIVGNMQYSIRWQGARRDTWIMDNNFSGDKFVGAVLVSGKLSELAENRPRAVVLTRNHCENILAGHYCLQVSNGTAPTIDAVTVTNNNLGPSTGVVLENVRGALIEGNVAFVTSAAELEGRPVRLAGAATQDIVYGVNTFGLSGFIVSPTVPELIQGALRSAVRFQPGFSAPSSGTITGLDGQTFSDTTLTVAMASAWAAFPTFPPSGYLLSVTVRDTGSAACPADDCVVVVKRDATYPGDRSDLRCFLSGVQDNVERQCHAFVPADANGNVYVDLKASGANTLTVYLRVQGYYQ